LAVSSALAPPVCWACSVIACLVLPLLLLPLP